MKILTFAQYYLPGFKAGGPVRTIHGMADYLGPELEFWIVTLDRDLGDSKPYPNVPIGEWTKLGNARVCYVPTTKGLSSVELLKQERWDVLYLNSFFSPSFSIRPLAWYRMGRLLAGNVLLATRGELSHGALAIKPWKKRAYRRLVRTSGFYRGVHWQASSDAERDLILEGARGIADPDRIFIAPDIPPKPSEEFQPTSLVDGDDERLRVVFLSRICRMKNLEQALSVLGGLEMPILFNIYGPVESSEQDYWQMCQGLIDELPGNIEVKYHGMVSPDEALAVFAAHDLFILPTRGENFGHVIFESLQVGCPVLLSDRTPWNDIAKCDLGWVVPLDDLAAYQNAIKQLHAESVEARRRRRNRCQEYASRFVSEWDVIRQNQQMFAALK